MIDRADRAKATRAGDFLYRYMWARRRCVKATAPDNRLADLIGEGAREFDGIDIEPAANPPIVWDGRHPDFFRAIIKEDDTAMPATADLAAWREYVNHNGPLPKPPEMEPAFPIRIRRSNDATPPPPAA